MSSKQENRVHEILRLMDEDQDLPTLSPIVEELLRLMKNEKVSVSELANVIKNDVSLSAKILKVVNSAFYGLPYKVATLSQAMVILGLSVIKNLALSMSILEVFIQKTPHLEKCESLKNFWERSLLSAVAARRLAMRIKHPADEEVFIAALFQNVGTLVFIKYYPEEYSALYEEAKRSVYDIKSLEEKHFGINHALIGEFMANKWQLPRRLSIPILYHHDPEKLLLGERDADTQEIHQITILVYLSNLVVSVFYDEFQTRRVQHLKQTAQQILGIQEHEIDQLLEHLAGDATEIADYFGLALRNVNSYSELLMAANMELGRINISFDQMNRELITAKLRVEELAEQLSEANHKLQELADTDGLTGISNRRVFENAITCEFYRSQRYGHPLSCLLLDLDHFKYINDTEGHLVGDQVLREVARLLRANLRRTDILARYGGEEFIALLPEAEQQAALAVAEKLRRTIEEYLFNVEGRPLKVTVSIGISTYSGASSASNEKELLQRADENLYQAKKHGRNQCWLEAPSPPSDIEEPTVIENIENALLTS
ncbi:MAG: GGDEF domain-containing protein [bacterium]